MRWVRGIDDNQIRTDDERYVIYREQRADGTKRFAAWGPEGSQEIDYMRAHTAARMRELMQVERRAQDLKMTSGRALIGLFTDPDEARDACLEFDACQDAA